VFSKRPLEAHGPKREQDRHRARDDVGRDEGQLRTDAEGEQL
jgi:hypothetical protein